MRMSPSATAFRINRLTFTRLADVVDDVVRSGRVAADSARHMIQIERVADLPRDHMIGARRVAAHSDGPHKKAAAVVERETAAEYVDASDFLPLEWVR